MEREQTLRILNALASGVHPGTGEQFSADSPYQHPDTVRALFDAGRLDDPGTLQAIADVSRHFGETLDPHTAVGYAVAQQHRRDPKVPMIVLATAHPAKFPDAVQKATGVRPPLPPRIDDLLDRTERADRLPNDADALKALIDERMSAKEQRGRTSRTKVRT